MLQDAMPEELLEAGTAWHRKWLEHKDREPVTPRNAWLEHQEKKRKELEELVPKKQYYTPELFEKLTGYAAYKFPQSFCDDCQSLFDNTGFSRSLNASQMLMANLLHETANFVFMKELASGEAYNNRHDLGNGPSDGPRFRGAGVLQLTGRHNYQQLADDADDPRVMEGVDYVAENYPFTSAVSWIKHNNLFHLAERGEFELICVRINGGKRGYADRCHKYAICQQVMV